MAIDIDLPPFLSARQGFSPDIGREASAEVGETMCVKYDEAWHRAIVLDKFFKAQKYTFPIGSIFYGYGQEKGEVYWCSAEVQINQMGIDLKPFCLIDKEGDGTIDARNTGGTIKRSVQSPQYHEEELPLSEGLHGEITRKLFRQEVVYQGVGTGTLRLLYREYVGDLARPAFSQDLTFTLEKEDAPTLVAVKGSRIEVLEANNIEVRYRVIRGFEQ